MVVYEVNLELDPEIQTEYVRWIRQQMRRILQLDGFEAVRVYRSLVDDPTDDLARLTVQYLVRDQAALDRYFQEYAGELRSEGNRLFGGRFQSSRRFLQHLETLLPA